MIHADWPAPANVVAGCTTRIGGLSAPPYASNNLGKHVGDSDTAVEHNRAQLARLTASEPGDWQWLAQTHGTQCVHIRRVIPHPVLADAATTRAHNTVCAVLTADCLPILLCDAAGTQVAAIHAGWRGLAAGIVGDTVERMQAGPGKPRDLMAWLGPAIGPDHFEVGEEVQQAFDQAAANGNWRGPCDASAFRASGPGKYHADLYQLGRSALGNVGVNKIYGGGHCSFREAKRFYSYRRDGHCGRMASFIYLRAMPAGD